MVLLEWLFPLFSPQLVASPQVLEVRPLELKAPTLVGSEAPSQESTASIFLHQI